MKIDLGITRGRDESGAAAVEFALVLPVLMLCFLGIVEGGSRYANQDQASHYAAVVARDIAIDPTRSVSSILADLKATDNNSRTYDAPTVQTCPSASASTTSQPATAKVTISATISSPTGMFGSYTVSGTGVARCEN